MAPGPSQADDAEKKTEEVMRRALELALPDVAFGMGGVPRNDNLEDIVAKLNEDFGCELMLMPEYDGSLPEGDQIADNIQKIAAKRDVKDWKPGYDFRRRLKDVWFHLVQHLPENRFFWLRVPCEDEVWWTGRQNRDHPQYETALWSTLQTEIVGPQEKLENESAENIELALTNLLNQYGST